MHLDINEIVTSVIVAIIGIITEKVKKVIDTRRRKSKKKRKRKKK